MLRRQMFWLPSSGFTKSADQSNPPGTRPMTLFVSDLNESAGRTRFKEWVDDETKLVLNREESFGENRKVLEFISLDVGPLEESVFNPELY